MESILFHMFKVIIIILDGRRQRQNIVDRLKNACPFLIIILEFSKDQLMAVITILTI